MWQSGQASGTQMHPFRASWRVEHMPCACSRLSSARFHLLSISWYLMVSIYLLKVTELPDEPRQHCRLLGKFWLDETWKSLKAHLSRWTWKAGIEHAMVVPLVEFHCRGWSRQWSRHLRDDPDRTGTGTWCLIAVSWLFPKSGVVFEISSNHWKIRSEMRTQDTVTYGYIWDIELMEPNTHHK